MPHWEPYEFSVLVVRPLKGFKYWPKFETLKKANVVTAFKFDRRLGGSDVRSCAGYKKKTITNLPPSTFCEILKRLKRPYCTRKRIPRSSTETVFPGVLLLKLVRCVVLKDRSIGPMSASCRTNVMPMACAVLPKAKGPTYLASWLMVSPLSRGRPRTRITTN